MSTVTSQDGTKIGFSKAGSGPTVILIHGATMQRAGDTAMAKLAELLAEDFTVYTYDRRGRGESGDTLPFAKEREIEDIEALIEDAGGQAMVFGISSGGALALNAAALLGDKIKKLVLYEVPYNTATDSEQAWRDYAKNLHELLAAGKKGDAMALFFGIVGMPKEQIDSMRQAPFWSSFGAIAPTLAYDYAQLGESGRVPIDEIAIITTPTLVMNGTMGDPSISLAADEIAKAMPHAERRSLDGQTHMVDSEVLAPELEEFFKA